MTFDVVTPIIALIGRPNSGKSALFNRLIGRRKAIVSPVYGTTRDVLREELFLGGKKAVLMDLAGLSPIETDLKSVHWTKESSAMREGKKALSRAMQEQAHAAMKEADVVLFCVDVSAPLTGEDLRIAEMLRKGRTFVIVAGTKADNETITAQADDVYGLGLGDVFLLSSEHNRGIAELRGALGKALAMLQKERGRKKTGENKPPSSSFQGGVTDETSRRGLNKEKEAPISFSLVGKPNVGKSSLFNALLGFKQVIVSDVPGTTRDSIDTLVERGKKRFLVVDTAGLRRPGKRERGIEFYSVRRSMDAIARSDVCLLLLDAMETVSHMDQAVSRYILKEVKGLIIVVNKWDRAKQSNVDRPTLIVRNKKHKDFHTTDSFPGEAMMHRYLDYLQDKLDYVPWAPVLFVSAETGEHVEEVWRQVEIVWQERNKRIGTGQFNAFLHKTVLTQHPTGTKGIFPKVYYGTQVDMNPPHFVIFVNQPDAFHFSWRRYLENRLREQFGFTGTPVTIEYRARRREDRRGGM